ncbi:sugar phosphate isomerase/epimerase family protein [Paenibacillus chartarius]|uniref:Sugar phosphate isomerase/epimerase family protein n=1 Tax=Paenibacillus chartarius TaxID=747481 RepID=A0ABV6DS96_9BACL
MIDKGSYSFSTCWNIKRHTSGAAMIEEIGGLGFRRVELNYNVTADMLAEIEPMIEAGRIGISSVHNVFPYVEDRDYDTDSVMLGFDDAEKRQKAVQLLLRTMEYAHRYGAEAVVVHPGEVPFESNIDAQLKLLYREQGKDSPAYRSLWEAMLERRERLSPVYAGRIRDSLEQVSEVAARKGWNVMIGIETRSRCYQIPTLQEAKLICEGLRGGPVRLWYDIGHAMMMERMGLYSNGEELRELLPYLYGVHIHETLDLSDHWCPYVHSGREDAFDPYLEAIGRAAVRVYELKDKCTAEDIERSHTAIAAKLEQRFRRISDGTESTDRG